MPSKREPLSPEMVEFAEHSGMKFLDRDGIRYGVEIVRYMDALRDHEPMVTLAGRDVIVCGHDRLAEPLWHLRLQPFYQESPQGLLYYYVPLPANLEIPESWNG